ncbi:tumor necrosis factor receptor superfamily member 4 isoform X1 [Neodiprion pinetum]|uniref:Tumor necrosis factor receptor superfamily member 4-like isoform X1 n=1 Tax=Neodiprion lecontei TaxID=441921 RepID=A0A6J0C910_NEOLC|nr:tumor necrosis factor receptor superfamily member 4-like isoform X1 [Neodiprion lecontei]XP_046488069.1 tumor necrosis factor receptor superfamily member 4-like isoform X1 [Neodiprion pinetum]
MFVENNRLAVAFALVVCLLAALLQLSDCRPHIRHHRGDSRCRRCEPGWGMTSRCSKGRDTECGKCTKGTYSPHHSVHPCWICSRCGPGLYEAHPCTSRADTVCDSCHRGPDEASENPDFRRKCKGLNFFLAPEDAANTGEQSVLVNEPEERFDMDGREIILREDVEAAAGAQLRNINY